ncbi:MAG: LON peptidase substrate-binding domain-containing protein [Candidatus Marinimicrobia bacterium]|nr:LON peptidase substrate-binding domain-containing protein [Candidatus Neomarinimicrobiota bacterium]
MKLYEKPLLESFSGSSPLFVQNDFVMFPKTGHMFTITDSNDLLMIKKILDTDQFLTVVLANNEVKSMAKGYPALYEVGTLVYIFDSEVKSSGKIIINVIGLEKVEINEAMHDLPYRTGAMTIIKDVISSPEITEKKRILDIFSEFLHVSKTDMEASLLNNPLINKEMITNIIASLISIPVHEQQKLLELPDISLRLNVVCQYLEKEIEKEEPSTLLKESLPIPPDWN